MPAIVPGTTLFTEADDSINKAIAFAEALGATTATDTSDEAAALIVTALEGLAGLSYAALDDLDSSGAGDLMQTALIASVAPTANQLIRANSNADGLEGVTPGTAAFADVVPSGAPTTASSSSNAITLDYDGLAVIQTTTTEAISTVTLDNIAAYSTVLWRIKVANVAHTVELPAGKVNGGDLTITASAAGTINVSIYNDNGTYEFTVGGTLETGA